MFTILKERRNVVNVCVLVYANYTSHNSTPAERPHLFFTHVIVSDQWKVSLQAQCGCRDVRRNGDGRDRVELNLTKQKRITGSLNVIYTIKTHTHTIMM